MSHAKYAILGLLILCSACAAKKPAPPPEKVLGLFAEPVTVIRDLPYINGMEKNPDLRLDVYANPHEGLRPVVVMIHGGAWIKGSKEQENYVLLCRALANSGYVVFNINHRLAPAAKVKQQAEDAMAAVIFAKLHAREYGGDPERVGVSGGSSGGHLAALIAWASDDPWFVPTGADAAGPDSDVRAAVLFYPVLDLERTFRENGSILGPSAGAILTGETGKDYEEALRHLAPMNHLDASAVPTLFLTGDADLLKLYPQSAEAEKRMRELGIDTGLYTAPGKDHAFTENYWEPETAESVRRMIAFFDKLLR